MSALPGVGDAAISVRDRFRGKIGLTKVRRYRRGMVPQWATDLDDDGDDYERTPRAASVTDSVPISRHSAARDGRRLGEGQEDLRWDHRCVRCKGHVVSAAEQEGEPREAAATEDDEAREERRRRIRERWLLRDLEEEELLPKEDEEVAAESESDSESEHEADTEEDDMRVGDVKPVFVPKPRRETVVERERIEEERQYFKEVARRRMELRKLETRRIIVEVIVKEEHTEKTRDEETDADIDTEDDDDDADDAWKNRELQRIKRVREARMREGAIEYKVMRNDWW